MYTHTCSTYILKGNENAMHIQASYNMLIQTPYVQHLALAMLLITQATQSCVGGTAVYDGGSTMFFILYTVILIVYPSNPIVRGTVKNSNTVCSPSTNSLCWRAPR